MKGTQCANLVFVLLASLSSSRAQDFFFPGQDNGEARKAEAAPKVGDVSGCVGENSLGELMSCVLPFKFGGVPFEGCITVSDPDGRPWCSTKVDADGNHLGGGGHWAHCDMETCSMSQDPRAVSNGGGGGGGGGGGSSEDNSAAEIEFQEDIEFKECNMDSGGKGECRPPSLCIGLSSAEEDANACQISTDGEDPIIGVCCTDDISLQTEQHLVPFAKEDVEERTESIAVGVSAEDIDSVLIATRFGLVEDEFEEQEDGEVDAPTAFHLRFNAPSDDAIEVDKKASELINTATRIQSDKSLSDSEAGIGLRMFNADSINAINKLCPWIPSPTCDRTEKFRTADGTCNNLREPVFGKAVTPYQRILLPEYTEGSIQLPRTSSVDGQDLPSARILSQKLTTSRNSVDNDHTTLVMQMGQFVDHDITHTPNYGVGCCGRGGSFPTSFNSEKCFPIKISSSDSFWGQRGKKCMSFARSLASPGIKCSLEFRQQMNQITHWLDNSNVYGSSSSMTKRLRRGSGGQLKITRVSGSREGSLPSCAAFRSTQGIGMCTGCSSCYFAGDVRANEQLNLIVMHTVWLREHNRLARALQRLNPHWDDERIFQEAKKITNAEYQHIIYKEWLPTILGNKFMRSFGLFPLSKGYSKEYRNDFDPRITNEFATAAFRFGHSTIPAFFNRIQRTRSGRGFTSKMSLRETFFKPGDMKKSFSMFDDLIRGLASQEGEAWDNAFVPDVKDHLFEGRPGTGGLDLVALNIQRGRDHGLAGYNAYREICRSGKGRAEDWNDLLDLIPDNLVSELRNLYASVDDIDLFVGGFLELPADDSILGPTFKCILGDQFARLKLGDRFFYDLGTDEHTKFTEAQLQQIRRTSMARIICDNTDTITKIQPQAFKVPGSSRVNIVQSCNSINIPSVNLGVFRHQTRSNVGR